MEHPGTLLHLRSPVLVAAGGVLLTALATGLVWREAAVSSRTRFDDAVEEAADRLHFRMDTYAAALRGLRGLYAIHPQVSRQDFRAYVQDLQLHRIYPGIQGLAWAPRVPPADVPAFAARLADEVPAAQLWPVRSDGQDRFPVAYIEPQDDRNLAALGFDLASDPTRLAALVQARDTGVLTATAPLTLAQEITHRKQLGFLLVLPVYKLHAAVAGLDERRMALAGFVTGVFRADDLLLALGIRTELDVAVEVYDVAPDGRRIVLHRGDGSPQVARYVAEKTYEVAGRTWLLRIVALPEFQDRLRGQLWLWTLVVGAFVTVLSWYVTLLQARTTRAAQRSATELARVAQALRDGETALRELNSELERRVTDRTAQLQAAVDDLEAFSYSVAHDLRAPLRAVSGFTAIVEEDAGEHLPEASRRQLAQVRRSAEEMGHLIDDLLTFSRLGKQELARADVDMNLLAQAVFQNLAAMEPDRMLQFRVGALPPAWGDPAMVRQVLVNLLGNAIKYTRGRDPAVLELDWDPGPGAYRLRDNGVGFDMRFASKLFGVFERLHPRDQFEGTGVGLALVQRIVLRHGGRVWAQGEPGVGATFWFTVGGQGSAGQDGGGEQGREGAT